MISKKITYTDYNGLERTEECLFNLTQSEIIEMEFSVDGGLQTFLQRIVDEKDSRRLMAEFKELILKAYGKKSDDGRRFIKSKELSAEFAQTEAYNQIFMELLSDADAAAAFVNGIMPKEIAEAMAEKKMPMAIAKPEA